MAAASKSQAKPDVRNLKLDLHYITTNSKTTTFTIVVKDNIISFSSWSTFKKNLENLDRPLGLVNSQGRQARVIPHYQPHFLQKIYVEVEIFQQFQWRQEQAQISDYQKTRKPTKDICPTYSFLFKR